MNQPRLRKKQKIDYVSEVNEILSSSDYDIIKVVSLIGLCRKHLGAYDHIIKLLDEHEIFKEYIVENINPINKSVLTTDKSLLRFWIALRYKNLDVENQIITLNDGISWIFSGKNKLFIRECYINIYDRICKSISGTNRFLILGNPGIGKTCFGKYLLYLLAAEGRDVVYHHISEKQVIYYFSSNEDIVKEANCCDIKELLQNSNVVYISDGIEPYFYRGVTILITSPDVKVYKQFAKEEGTYKLFYMPVWSKQEIESASKNMDFTNKGDDVDELYEIFGGIPRYVLDKSLSTSIESLKSAISTCDTDSLMKFIGESDVSKDTRHILVHIVTDENYNKVNMTFASEYIQNQLREKFEINKSSKLLNIFTSSTESTINRGVCGVLFEHMVHKLLTESGKNFNTKALDENANQPSDILLNVGKVAVKSFKNIDNINKEHCSKYIVPSASNFESIDSLIPYSDSCHILFQITISPNHGIKQSGLDRVIKHLDNVFPMNNYPIKLYFVVPENIYKIIKKQDIQDKNGKALTITLNSVKRIQQFALCVKLYD